jgi:prolyl 4-hydroxylase
MSHKLLFACLAGLCTQVHEAIMTFQQAKEFADAHPNCQGFTYESEERYPKTPVRVWFKSRLNVLYNEDWWSWSTGHGM